ncbi:MAG: hypothetical protein PVH00_03950 [Gemmatimonadota bacterium]|jgi:hypothetical protein
MPGLGTPFGRHRGSATAVWPAWTGPTRLAVRGARLPDPWLVPPDDFDGETVLDDLANAADPRDAARILARYLVVRLLRAGFAAGPGFAPRFDRAAAADFLASLPAGDPDRRVLAPFLDARPTDPLGRHFPLRIAAAAATALQQGRHRCAFALLHAGYGLAAARQRHRDAARLARSLASLASSHKAHAAARRWGLRARVHDRRAAP